MRKLSMPTDIKFTAKDVRTLNKRNVYYVGAHYKEAGSAYENQMCDFHARGVWENGYGLSNDVYNERLASMEKGDVLLVKKLCGQGSTEMKVIASGIVVGFGCDPTLTDTDKKFGRTTAYVYWCFTDLEDMVPLKAFGTVSASLAYDDLGKDVATIARKTVTRFINKNLTINKSDSLC